MKNVNKNYEYTKSSKNACPGEQILNQKKARKLPSEFEKVRESEEGEGGWITKQLMATIENMPKCQ